MGPSTSEDRTPPAVVGPNPGNDIHPCRTGFSDLLLVILIRINLAKYRIQ